MTNTQPKTRDWEPWNKDTWQEEMETHPIFRTQPIKQDEELPPLIEALQNLKYDPAENTAEELAEAYKFDGNENFRLKKYRWAADNYTKGLEIKCNNDVLNAQLYANRSAAEYHIGNFKKALGDAEKSKKLKPDHIKALQRGAMCCFELQEWEDCISWCEEGLNVTPDDKILLDLKNKVGEKKKIFERNRRKASMLEVKKKKELEEVKKAIKERGISISEENLTTCDRPVHPMVSDTMVCLKKGKLVWPVIFLYPEYGTTDYIKEFHEESSFRDHLNLMFDPTNPPDWDLNQEYVAENLQLYFSNEHFLFPFEHSKTLQEILSCSRYIVHGLTPCFIITVHGSKFDHQFRKQYTIITDCLKS